MHRHSSSHCYGGQGALVLQAMLVEDTYNPGALVVVKAMHRQFAYAGQRVRSSGCRLVGQQLPSHCYRPLLGHQDTLAFAE